MATKPKPGAKKPEPATSKVKANPPRRQGEKELPRVAAPAAAAAGVSAAQAATDPMLLGAFALFTLALSSTGLLLVFHRATRQGPPA